MSTSVCNTWPISKYPLGVITDPPAEPRLEFREDDVLVQASREGDAEAFGILIKRHDQFCLKVALLIVRNRSDAEDVLQNAFAKAWQRLWQYTGRGAFPAWLQRIVSNECLMWLRERRSSRFVWIDKSLSYAALDTIRGGPLTRMELVDQRALPEDEFADRELTEVFKREIRRIPPSMRNALVMADIDRLPIRDVAEQLGITVPAAKSRLMRARSELKSRMKKFCGLKGAATLIGRPVHSTTAYARG